MNVSLINNDSVRGVIRLEIVKSDYEAAVDKNLRSLRQKANVPGFRKGKVPMGMIKKMYGKHVLVEEVNNLVSQNLYKYIQENNLHTLGEPLTSETEPSVVDFDTQEDFVFNFDIALAPEIYINLSKDDTLPYYQIKIDDEMVNKQVEAYAANFGTYDKVEDVEEKDLVKGTIAELENGSPKEGGIIVENGVLMPLYIKDDIEKAKFIGAKVNTVIVFNPNKAFENAEAEIANLLHISKEQVPNLTGDFSFEIKEITRHKNAELNQELYDKVFGENVITSEEEFKNKIREALKEQLEPQSNFKFLNDARDFLIKKVGDLNFADDILKRWLLISNSKNTVENIEKEYPHIIQDLTFHLIRDYLIKTNDLNVSDNEVEEYTTRVAKAQFAQYGMLSVPEDVLNNYAKEMMKNKQTVQNIIERTIEEKLANWLKEQITTDIKEVSTEEFSKLFSTEQA